MNPADTRYSVDIDSIQVRDEPRCEMCGRSTCDCDDDEAGPALHRALERVYRLCEWAVWCNMTSKALGSTMRVIAAKTINPGASVQQVAAVVGMKKAGVYVAMKRIEKSLPHVYAALWGERSEASRQKVHRAQMAELLARHRAGMGVADPRQGTPKADRESGV